MELSQLLYAVALADQLNFSRAAQALFVTQPSMSQQIQKLEFECGFQLFIRSSKQVMLTPEGERFIAQARKIMTELSQIQELVKDINRQIASNITIGIGMVGRSYVADSTTEVIRSHPNIKFNLIEAWGSDLLQMVKKGQIDIALMGLDHDLNNEKQLIDLSITPINEEHICALMSKNHRLSSRKSVCLEELVEDTLLFTSPRSSLRRLMIKCYEDKGLMPRLGMDLNSADTCISFVTNGTGVTFITDARAKLLSQERLAIIPVEPPIYRTYALVAKKGQRNLYPIIYALEQTLFKSLR